MFRISRVKSEILGLVGFRQPTLTGYDIVDSDNQASSSGLFFQDSSFLVTIKNIKENQEDPDITDPNFNALLRQMQETCIVDVIHKVTKGYSDHYITRNLYPFEKTFDRTLPVNGKFAGLKVYQEFNVDMLTEISNIEIAFNEAVTFNLYRFNSNRKNPVNQVEVTSSPGEAVQVPVSWLLADDLAFKGGNDFIGYFEEDLGSARPYQKNFELSNYQRRGRCWYIEPTKIDHSSRVLDTSSYTYEPDTGGLGMTINVYTDYAELMIRNKMKLAYAIQLEMAIRVLNLIINSTRSNRDQRLTKKNTEQAMVELHGFKSDNVFVEGLISRSNKAVSDLRKDFFYTPKIARATLRC